MGTILLTAFALMLVIEGILPFLVPGLWRETFRRLIEMSDGGFGTFLIQAHEWANPAATRRSYELIAQHLMGRFQGSAQRPTEQRDWAAANRQEFMGAAGSAIMSQFQQHAEEKAARESAGASAD